MKRAMFVVGTSMVLSAVVTSGEDSDEANKLLSEASKAAEAGESQRAVELATSALKQQPDLAVAYYLRGREHFRIGKVSESVADLDKYVKLRPKLEPRQWERGISYYYAKQFKKGEKQFELYQTYHDNDVENSTWRYLCMARTVGVKKARETMLPIKNDRRVPMMQIFDMFRGKLKPDEVLAAAKAGNPDPSALNRRLFYAHLYIGLFHEADGKTELAKQHIGKAATDHKIGHYMWDVARVHFDLLKKPRQK